MTDERVRFLGLCGMIDPSVSQPGHPPWPGQAGSWGRSAPPAVTADGYALR